MNISTMLMSIPKYGFIVFWGWNKQGLCTGWFCVSIWHEQWPSSYWSVVLILHSTAEWQTIKTGYSQKIINMKFKCSLKFNRLLSQLRKTELFLTFSIFFLTFEISTYTDFCRYWTFVYTILVSFQWKDDFKNLLWVNSSVSHFSVKISKPF